MRRVRKHVDDAGRLERVALLMDQHAGVPSERARMAGHVHDTPSADHSHVTHDLSCAAPCRVEKDPVPSAGQPALGAVDRGQVGDTKGGVIDRVVTRIGARPLDE